MSLWVYRSISVPLSALGKRSNFFKGSVIALTLIMTGCNPGSNQAPIESRQAAQTPPLTTAPVPQAQPVAPPAPPPTLTADGLPAPRGQRIALLLPLSGDAAPLGRILLDAAQMALFDLGGVPIELMPLDDKGTVDGAVEAAHKAMDSGASLVIGPVFSPSAAAVGNAVASRNINVLSFTNDSSVAGGNVFTLGITPEQQVMEAVSFARELGKGRAAILAPDNPFGLKIANAVTGGMARLGGSVTHRVLYRPNVDFNSPEWFGQLAQLKAGGFDLLVAPEGGPRLKVMAGVVQSSLTPGSPPQWIGSLLWNDLALAQEPVLNGGLFAAPQPDRAERTAFGARFRQSYNRDPNLLASLAYDAVALAGLLSQDPSAQQNGQFFSADALRDPAGFAGVEGIFRFDQRNVALRGLAILRYEGGSIVMVRPAPQSFEAVPSQ